MIEKQWKVPWELVERIEEIRVLVHKLQASLTHTFREGNCVADSLANEVVESQTTKEYNTFQELPNTKHHIQEKKNHNTNMLIMRKKSINSQEQGKHRYNSVRITLNKNCKHRESDKRNITSTLKKVRTIISSYQTLHQVGSRSFRAIQYTMKRNREGRLNDLQE
ncbi:hypothetical protein H5410_051754 [Solanum commersonii]|uniref:RNase H type-1 domain-containing protein n=1 Tax=Solanum commersonii TaxID=4109 RepID=A0A9J5X0D3_SOLCO|nr:hypothetical protein H5410_051754 [Solanum commersonii]